MIQYESYTIENDSIYKQRPHIYWLMGAKANSLFAVATYSLKTKRLTIKRADEQIPPTHILQEFIDYCKSKGEWK